MYAQGVGLERRLFPRYAVSCPVQFEVELLGSEFLVERFDSSGTLINISRRGMLAQVDRLLAVGTGCSVSLVHAKGMVYPPEIRGVVRRSEAGRAGWEIGIEFEDLVDVRAQPARLA